MLPLMPIIADYRKKKVSFQLIEPQNDILQRLFFNTNWAHYINPDKYDRTPHEGGHVPALRFGDDGTSATDEILNRVMNLILGQLETDRATLKAVEWSLGEIMDNVVNHSQSSVGGFVQATAYKGSNRSSLLLPGIGIPRSMNITITRKRFDKRSTKASRETRAKTPAMVSTEATGSQLFQAANSSVIPLTGW